MKLEDTLGQNKLVLVSPSLEEVRERAKISQPVRLFYGETYDERGATLDSMKYYFFVDELSRSLRKEGFMTNSEILIADTAACRNVSPDLEGDYMRMGRERAGFVGAVNEIYGLDLKVVRMSDYIGSHDFVSEREEIMAMCREDPELMEAVERTVPESKLELEREKGFMYSFDEIATIMDLDVKVGPPREDLYDGVSRTIAARMGRKGLMSLFLTPTFPLGKGWSYFFKNESIESHGITAYKGGSKRLHQHRILIGRTRPEYAAQLIDTSFISDDPSLPNPVLDVGIIVEMARKRLEGTDLPITLADEFYGGEISKEDLRRRVAESLNTYVLSRF